MYDALRQIGPIVLLVIWFCGQLVLYFWYRVKERLYLQHFPPVDGVPLDMMLPGMNPWNGKGAIREVLRQRHADPALERLRHDVWRRGFCMMLWTFGGFLVIIIVMIMTSWR